MDRETTNMDAETTNTDGETTAAIVRTTVGAGIAAFWGGLLIAIASIVLGGATAIDGLQQDPIVTNGLISIGVVLIAAAIGGLWYVANERSSVLTFGAGVAVLGGALVGIGALFGLLGGDPAAAFTTVLAGGFGFLVGSGVLGLATWRGSGLPVSSMAGLSLLVSSVLVFGFNTENALALLGLPLAVTWGGIGYSVFVNRERTGSTTVAA